MEADQVERVAEFPAGRIRGMVAVQEVPAVI